LGTNEWTFQLPDWVQGKTQVRTNRFVPFNTILQPTECSLTKHKLGTIRANPNDLKKSTNWEPTKPSKINKIPFQGDKDL